MLNWNKEDIERKFGFEGKKYTGVSFISSILLGSLITVAFYAILYHFYQQDNCSPFVEMFFHGGVANRSVLPYFIVFLSAWCLAILIIKFLKLKLQSKALKIDIVPSENSFVLSPDTSSDILLTLLSSVDDPKRFLLFNRIERSLASLKNIGRASDFIEVFKVQSENDESYIESSYTTIRGFIWAIPVLGFIGTVLGLSEAIGGFGKVVSQGAELAELKSSLGIVTGGLATAFETTLIALVASIIIQLLLTFLKKQEEDFLDECEDYCHKNIISKLKIMLVD